MTTTVFAAFELTREVDPATGHPRTLDATFFGSGDSLDAANQRVRAATEQDYPAELAPPEYTQIDGLLTARIPGGVSESVGTWTGGRKLRLQILPRLLWTAAIVIPLPREPWTRPPAPTGGVWRTPSDVIARAWAEQRDIGVEFDRLDEIPGGQLNLLVDWFDEPGAGPVLEVKWTFTNPDRAQTALRTLTGWFEHETGRAADWLPGVHGQDVAVLPAAPDPRGGEPPATMLSHVLAVLTVPRPAYPELERKPDPTGFHGWRNDTSSAFQPYEPQFTDTFRQ